MHSARQFAALTLAALMLVSGVFVSGSAAFAADAPIVTAIGKIGAGNRGGLDPFRDAFLAHRDKAFDKAFTFTREALAGLPQASITARAEGWPQTVKVTGPKIGDVLKAAGIAADATIVVTALDGYTVELSAADREKNTWVLGIDADGAPLALGARGPAWLLHDTGGKTVGPEIEANWVWALYLIEAK